MSQERWQPSGGNSAGSQLIGGRYRLGRFLGGGAFGQVYQAEDIKFNPPKLVALKMLNQQFLGDPEVIHDIEREASILAQFSHPNILQVLDFEVSSHMAYIVTNLAEGGSLAQKLRPDLSTPPVRLLMQDVSHYLKKIASGLDEAHSHHLIHRDLKPLNILVDKWGNPLIADFGLATALAHSQSTVMMQVSTSGTPPYMAPELWMGEAGKASDIYALAVMTYQMLTGQLPFQGTPDALAYQHMHGPVPLLSHRAPDLVYSPALDEVIAGGMAKDPHQRTRPASEFYRRFQAALNYSATSPVAQPVPQPVKRVAELNPRPVHEIQVPDKIEAVYQDPGYSPTEALYQGPSYSPTEVAKYDPRYMATQVAGNGTDPIPVVNTSPIPIKIPEQSPLKVKRPGPPTRKKGLNIWLLAGIAGVLILIGIVFISYMIFSNNISSRVLNGHTNSVNSVAYSPDGRTLASGSDDKTIRLWDVATGQQKGQPLSGNTDDVLSVAFSPDGKTLATASFDKTIRLWDVATGQQKGQPLSVQSNGLTNLAFSPDGKILAFGANDTTVRLWDVATGQQKSQFLSGHTAGVIGIAFSPDGKTLASKSGDLTIRLWDVATGQQKGQPISIQKNSLSTVAFSPDGKTLAASNADQTIQFWDVATGQAKGQPLATCTTRVSSIAFSPDGKTLASGCSDRTIHLWDVATGQQKGQPLTGHTDGVLSVAFSPDGKTLASGSGDETIRLWNINP